jgi:hypothetical protein
LGLQCCLVDQIPTVAYLAQRFRPKVSVVEQAKCMMFFCLDTLRGVAFVPSLGGWKSLLASIQLVLTTTSGLSPVHCPRGCKRTLQVDVSHTFVCSSAGGGLL